MEEADFWRIGYEQGALAPRESLPLAPIDNSKVTVWSGQTD